LRNFCPVFQAQARILPILTQVPDGIKGHAMTEARCHCEEVAECPFPPATKQSLPSQIASLPEKCVRALLIT